MIKQQLLDAQTTAIKSKNLETLSVIRYILAQIKNKEIETRTDITEEEALTVLKKEAKKLNESIDAFQKANRPELVAQYKAQLEILQQYLPAEISDEDLTKAVDELVAANQALIQQNPKMIIGLAMKELKPKADPQRIMQALKQRQLA